MFTLLNPVFLVGLLAAAIPLIIHLSKSKRTKKMRFSTTRFLTDQFLRSYRMSRLKELLLLALRMALCALFAMALAQPLLLPKSSLFRAGQSRSVVLVVDNSASMGYADASGTPLDRARRAARELLDGLRPGDTAALVLAGRRAAGPEAVFAEPTTELGDVRQAVDALAPTALATDLGAAVRRAEEIVQASTASSREIHVLSDMQRTAWSGVETEPPAARSDLLYFFVGLRPPAPVKNLAVTAVQYAASRPMVGVPFAFRPHVFTQSGDYPSCEISLVVDGKKVAQQQLDKLAAGRWTVGRFYHTFGAGGWHSGYVEVKGDGFEADNRRYFALEVLDSLQVLLVNGAPSSVAAQDELFFVRAALSAGGGEKQTLAATAVAPADLAAQDLDKFGLVVLANVESLPAPAVEKLEAWTDRGGSVLAFLGNQAQPKFYNETLAGPARLHGGLLPARLVGIEGNPDAEKESALVGELDENHFVLSGFDEGASGLFGSVRIKALWTVEPGSNPVLMRASTGSPLLVEKAFGKGRSMLFATSCDRDWSNFPVRPAFVPWLFRVVGYLGQDPQVAQGAYVTGEEIPAPISALEGVPQLIVRSPSGAVHDAVLGNTPESQLVIADTAEAGVYAVHPPGRERDASSVAVNLDAFESDLTYLGGPSAAEATGADGSAVIALAGEVEAELKDLLPGRPLLAYVAQPEQAAATAQSARHGIALWDWLLWGALAAALFEPWFANRITRERYLKPRATAAGLPFASGAAR